MLSHDKGKAIVMLEVERFPGCCGIRIIHNLGNDLDGHKRSVRRVESEIKNVIREYIGNDVRHRRVLYPLSHLVITINNHQQPIYKDMLKRLGFRCVSKATNGGHNTKVYIYVLARKGK